MAEGEAEGRIYFSNSGRTFGEEDEIEVTSVGVDIGSSTSHLVFSRILLERLDARYVVSSREAFFESEVLLTPYAQGESIDAQALGEFIARQYAAASLAPEKIDTGALILTGVAVRRANARAIGELFAAQAGKLVAVSAGDNLETVMAAYGSGAVARSIRDNAAILNVDIGGGTAKLAICAEGKVVDVTAIDIGARLVAFDAEGRIVRIEEAGRRLARDLGFDLALGAELATKEREALAHAMVDHLFAAMKGESTPLLRLDPLSYAGKVHQLSFSGGVAEYIYGRERQSFGDLGFPLAAAIGARVQRTGLRLVQASAGIRATVIGASQYTMQVSGSTIFVAPLDILPLRNLPVIAPELALDEEIDPEAIAAAVQAALRRLDLAQGDSAVALCYRWRGSATFQRLSAFCRGIAQGLSTLLAQGHPIVLVGDGDVGGLIGMHCREELALPNAVVSIDGIELKEFDYIDIGALLPGSGAAPVVIKSLIFPASAAVGREWEKVGVE